MNILHTSDWHLGRSLYGKKRYKEFTAFLDWLIKTIDREHIDIMLVAGDVFDTTTPSNKAQSLYYQFLAKAAQTRCRHTVIIGGNHDSPSFLNAPRTLLQSMNIHIVGEATLQPEDEVITLYNAQQPEAIICAVPYLRDQNIRTAAPGETIDDKNVKLVAGVKKHYASVCEIAEKQRLQFKEQGYLVPIIGMGHLFTAGGKTIGGDGVRELYVGSLAHIHSDTFPNVLDYLALGHLHVPQKVGDSDRMRYCGSPIPMGYGEATQEKQVIKITFNNIEPTIKEIPVPCFQPLVRIEGSMPQIFEQINDLKRKNSQAWLEINYIDKRLANHLRSTLEEHIADSGLEILRIKNPQLMRSLTSSAFESEILDDLDINDVFHKCLNAYQVPEDDQQELIATYKEVVQNLQEADVNAE